MFTFGFTFHPTWLDEIGTLTECGAVLSVSNMKGLMKSIFRYKRILIKIVMISQPNICSLSWRDAKNGNRKNKHEN